MKSIALAGAVLGLTSIMMGAAADHIFAGFLTADNAGSLDTALRYHQLYAVLIFCLGIYGKNKEQENLLRLSGYIFSAGTILFCAGIYISFLPALKNAVYLTPIGGLLLMAGWSICVLALLGKKL